MRFLTNKFKLNKESELTDPELHDCEIIELKISGVHENRTLTIQLVDESGVDICMTLQGATLIYCTAFRVQNVVSYVGLHSGVDCSEDLQKLEGIETTKEMTKALNAQIMNGELGLVRVIPSVGCEIYCICKALEIK